MSHLEDLIKIGFTEYEAKVYLSLLSENPSSGYQISKKAGVPRSMVYEALGRLHARGAVLRTEEQRTTIYRPVPPEMLLDRYEQEQHRLIHSLRESLNLLFVAKDEDYIWSLSGYSSVLSYAVQMIQEATQELMLVLPDSVLDALRVEIEASCDRGISISALLTGAGELSIGHITRHPPAESEMQNLTNMLVVVADGKKCMIASADQDMSATITSNPNLVLIAHQFVWMEMFAQRQMKE